MDAFIPSPGSISNCNNSTENETRKHLNSSVAYYDDTTTQVSRPPFYNNLLSEQSSKNDSLKSQEFKMFVIQNPQTKAAYLIQPPVGSLSRPIDTSSTIDHALSDSSYDSSNFNMARQNCMSSPVSTQSAACQTVEQLCSTTRQSFEVNKHGIFNNNANKSPVFKQRLRYDNAPACKMSVSADLSSLNDPNDKTSMEFSKFSRHAGNFNLHRMATPRPSIHVNKNEPSTSRQNFIEPNQMAYTIMPQSQFHSGSLPLQSCSTNNLHMQQSLQNKQSYHNRPQWHIPQHQQQNISCKHPTSLVCRYESPNLKQLPICSSPFNNVFAPSRPQHEQTTNEIHNADHLSAYQKSMIPQQMTPECNTFLNSPQDRSQWPHQLNQTQLIHNNLAVSSQAVTSPYFANSGTYSHQCSQHAPSMTCQSKLITSHLKFSAKELPSSINSSCQEKESNVSSFPTPSQFPDTSHFKHSDFQATKISMLPPSTQSLPICQSDSQLVSLENLNKSLPTCQMRFGAISKAEDVEHELATKGKRKKVNIHHKEFKEVKDSSKDESERTNGSKISSGIQSKDTLNAATLEKSNQSNKNKVYNTAGQDKSISSKEKTVNGLVSISAGSRINPHSSITSIKAKSKVIIKSVEPSSFKNAIVSKIGASSVFIKPIVSVETNREEAGVKRIYIKQNQQKSFIQPTKPIKPILDRRKQSLEVIQLKDNSVQLKSDSNLTVCKHCGVVQKVKNISQCIRCQNPLFKRTNEVNPCNDTDSATKKNIEVLSSKSESLDEKEDIIVKLSKEQTEELNNLNSSDNDNAINHSEQNESGKINTSDEPEIYILSSDDEEQSHRKRQKLKFELQTIKSAEQDSASQKNLEQNSYLSGGGLTFDEEWENESNFESASATNIHIGNFEVNNDELCKKAPERVYFRKGQIQFEVTGVIKGEEMEAEWLKINEDDIETIVCHFGSSFPGSIMMVLMKPGPAEQIKKKLGMTEESNFNFDPTSSDPTVRYVILKLQSDKLNELVVDNILECFNVTMTECIDKETMNNMLSEALSEGKERGHPSQTLLIYPPPPCRGGITITTKDYYCLEESQFLNDVILDFYLKYLVLEKLSEKDKERTHLFSTFFYKRLTSKPKMGKNTLEDNRVRTSAEIRHARVKSWTKDVDIFEKDFIIIPINERSHWFLAIICFPGLVPSTPAGNTANANTSKSLIHPKQKKVEVPIVENIEWSDKDEAESEDDDIVAETDEEPQTKKLCQENDAETLGIRQKIQYTKQPCILIFDSLAGASRSRIVATLRDYLTVEYFEKKKIQKIFSKDLIKGAYLSVPQQTNFTDCGIFTLQFAESFFENPLKTFQFPIPSLRNWFAQDRVSCKREFIARKIEELMNKFKPNHGIKLMKIICKSPEEEVEKCSKLETKVTEKPQVICDLKSSIKSKVSDDADLAKPKKLQISKLDTSKEIIVEDIRPVATTSTLSRIPKRPLTPGPYRKPAPKYPSPLADLYGDKSSVLQRSIDAKSISVTNVNHNSISNNNRKFLQSKFSSNSSHFLKPNSLNGDKSYCKATSSGLDGGGIILNSEEDDVIFENEILKPKLGDSLNSQKITTTTVLNNCRGIQPQTFFKRKS